MVFLELAGLLHGASAVFTVKDGNGTACIMANFSAAFSTNYNTKSGSKVGNTKVLHAFRVCVCWCVWRLLKIFKNIFEKCSHLYTVLPAYFLLGSLLTCAVEYTKTKVIIYKPFVLCFHCFIMSIFLVFFVIIFYNHKVILHYVSEPNF